MPELPEVEAQRRLLHERAVGSRIKAVVVTEQGGGPRDGEFDDKVIAEGVTAGQLAAALEGAFILSAQRKGKQLWLELGEATTGPATRSLLIHLGMTGSVVVQGVEAPQYKNFTIDIDVWPPRFTKLEMVMSDGAAIAYTDPRRFGRILLRGADACASPPLSLLARDPVASPPLKHEFRSILCRLSSPIKAALLDQNRVVCGVGNWVADEVLYQAAILPSNPCNSLSDEQLNKLHAALLRICAEACACNADSSRFPPHWLFHHRWQNLTSGSMMSPIGRIHFDTVGGRTTAFLPSVQRKGERKHQDSEGAEVPKGGKGQPRGSTKGRAVSSDIAGDKSEAASQDDTSREGGSLRVPTAQTKKGPRATSASGGDTIEEVEADAPASSKRTKRSSAPTKRAAPVNAVNVVGKMQASSVAANKRRKANSELTSANPHKEEEGRSAPGTRSLRPRRRRDEHQL